MTLPEALVFFRECAGVPVFLVVVIYCSKHETFSYLLLRKARGPHQCRGPSWKCEGMWLICRLLLFLDALRLALRSLIYSTCTESWFIIKAIPHKEVRCEWVRCWCLTQWGGLCGGLVADWCQVRTDRRNCTALISAGSFSDGGNPLRAGNRSPWSPPSSRNCWVLEAKSIQQEVFRNKNTAFLMLINVSTTTEFAKSHWSFFFLMLWSSLSVLLKGGGGRRFPLKWPQGRTCLTVDFRACC